MFELPKLEYNYTDLEPYIDAKTMEIHHTKHHQTYITNLNNALQNNPELLGKDILDLVANVNTLPDTVKTAVKNNGGGHLNHTMFWKMLINKTTQPSQTLMDEITTNFQTFDTFKEEFQKAGLGRFGSGWVWLCVDQNKKLVIVSTANQDNPVSDGLKPILGVDVWEHAYYLNYQNKRADYLTSIWHVINWEEVSRLFSLSNS